RHAGLRAAREEMPAPVTSTRITVRGLPLAAVLWLLPLTHAVAFTAYVSNEKGNTVTVIDTDKMAAVKTIKVGQRPRGIELTKDGAFVLVAVGDDDTIQMIDTKTGEIAGTLPSGPDPELFALDPSGKTL